MDHRLQPVQPQDYALIAAWLDSAAGTLCWAGPGVPYPLPPDRFERVLQLRERPGWLLLDASDQRVGFGQAWSTQPGTVHLGRLLVAPQARGRGLGRGLVQALIVQALQADAVERLTLRVYRDNAAAVALYRSLGFEPVDAASTPALLFMQQARR
ncbi:GNAT family N-acetyltransferase [Stenotrophomonas maltophilia]|uniref:GNAT family N-acetyltransferase n=1 Tax=Stenotrophomonas maltophilia TaxID=40324 RepID=UPI000C269A81|nr:GNAT family N-acetyltransferase [Stenotrophomonas maltophilia]PJL58513.1 GNAT family N-acetyltransferase [Stenotrophomonas maltophilia]